MNMTKKEINQLKDLLFKLEQDTRLKDVLNASEVFETVILYAEDEEDETEEMLLQTVLTKLLNA